MDLWQHASDEASVTVQHKLVGEVKRSKRIAQLEASLGTKLLVRNRRGVEPTAAGLALLEHARNMLFTAERIQSEKRPRHSASDRHQHGFPAMIPPLHKENPQASSRALTRCAKGRKRARRVSAPASSAARKIRPLS